MDVERRPIRRPVSLGYRVAHPLKAFGKSEIDFNGVSMQGDSMTSSHLVVILRIIDLSDAIIEFLGRFNGIKLGL